MTFKSISTQEAVALLLERKFDELAYITGADVLCYCTSATLENPLSLLLSRKWLRRVEPVRKVIHVGVIPDVGPRGVYDLHLNVAEFTGRKIQVIVEEIE